MGPRRPFAVRTPLLGFALTCAALLACKSSSEKKEAPLATAAPAAPAAEPAAAPTVSAVEERPSAESGKPRPLTSEEITSRLKQTMHGHKAIPEHSFALTVAGLGDISVLSTLSPNGTEFVFHVYNGEGKRTQSLLNKNASDAQGKKLLAIAFPDIDGDGNEDLIVLGAYASLGDTANAAGVFTRPGGGRFVFDEQRSHKASKGSPSSIMAAARAAR